MDTVIKGRYRHYKGNEYQVIGVAHHSETEEPLVVYRALYGAYGLWVRPLKMFTEMVNLDGNEQQRFQLIEPASVSKNQTEQC